MGPRTSPQIIELDILPKHKRTQIFLLPTNHTPVELSVKDFS